MKHLISVYDITSDEVHSIINLAGELKMKQKSGTPHTYLQGKTLAMIFMKASTRTRVSFEAGMYQLGGYPLYLSAADLQLGRGETIEDTAKTLSRYVDCIMIRTFAHKDVQDLASYGSVPVINGLTDLMHPCQALADIFTIYEAKQHLKGLKLGYVGDGNNVANSLLHICAKVGMNIAVATPPGFECDKSVVQEAMKDAGINGSSIIQTNDPVEAVKGADAVYTDTWTSMGKEAEKEQRNSIFMPYQVNAHLFSQARNNAIFMHCLPAYRGSEVTSDVIDGKSSVVFEEAENRLHVQKAIMLMLMEG